MLKSWKFWVINSLILGSIGIFAFGLLTDPKLVPSPFIGKTAPEFEITSLDGLTNLKLSDLRGKPVVLNFWAPWCPPCRVESKVLEAFYQKYEKKEQKIRLLGIAFQDTKENVIAFAKRFGKNYFLGLDGNDGQITIDYGVYGPPETFFIDSNGIVRFKQVGAVTPKLMEQKIQDLLSDN